MRSLERELLAQLAATPLLDRVELAAISGRSTSAVYAGVEALEREGLVVWTLHATEQVRSTRRVHLTADGLDHMARESGTNTAALLSDHPASEQWLRALLRRLDAVAVIYRLASALCEAAFPIRVRWYRSAPADAAIALPDGRTLAIVRWGRSVERTAFARRVRRLREGAEYSAALLLAPDEVRLRHARRLAASLPFPCFLTLENSVAAASAETPIWQVPSGGSRISLTTALRFVRRRGSWTREAARQRRTPPRSLSLGDGADDWRLPSQLKPAQKRTLDLIADWPWIAPHHLEGLLGVQRRRVSGLIQQLSQPRLITSPKLAGQRRLVLTDRALAMIAQRDRASPAAARERWSASPLDRDAALDWRNVSGTRSRQLLRHMDHTEAVHEFVAQLATQARAKHLQLRQLDPPQRASRYFRHQGRLHSIQPDAYGLLLGGARQPFFLEWERRAIRPRTMAARLAPYLRYFQGRRPLDDHGAQPRLVIVFEQDLLASRFLRVARDEFERAGVDVPLFVSDRERLQADGPLGSIWLSAEGWDRQRAFSSG